MASVTSITDGLPMGLLSNEAISGVTDKDKIKSCCKALEGLFASQLLKEIGQGIGDKQDPTSGQYSDFIQQALAQQVTSGGGFGLSKMLEASLTKNAAANHVVPTAYTQALNHAHHGTH